MKFVRQGILVGTAIVALSLPGVACDNTAREKREEAAEAQRDADKKAAEAREEAREEARDARQTAAESPSRVGAATETVDVKAALMADKTVDASGINVDTFAETKTVVLRGTVTSDVQKEAAGRIARAEAEGYKVDNQLVVVPPKR